MDEYHFPSLGLVVIDKEIIYTYMREKNYKIVRKSNNSLKHLPFYLPQNLQNKQNKTKKKKDKHI